MDGKILALEAQEQRDGVSDEGGHCHVQSFPLESGLPWCSPFQGPHSERQSKKVSTGETIVAVRFQDAAKLPVTRLFLKVTSDGRDRGLSFIFSYFNQLPEASGAADEASALKSHCRRDGQKRPELGGKWWRS